MQNALPKQNLCHYVAGLHTLLAQSSKNKYYVQVKIHGYIQKYSYF